MKLNAPQDGERPTPSTEVHATQSIGTQDRDTNEEESLQVIQIKHSTPEDMPSGTYTVPRSPQFLQMAYACTIACMRRKILTG